MIYQFEWLFILGLFTITLLLFFAICFFISFFYINWDDRSQLIERKYYLYAISSIPGTIYMLIPHIMTELDILIIIIITLITSFIVKFVRFKYFEFKELSQIKELERGKNLLEVKNLKVYYPLLKPPMLFMVQSKLPLKQKKIMKRKWSCSISAVTDILIILPTQCFLRENS